MNENQLIDLLKETKDEPQQVESIKLRIVDTLCVNNCPDLTDLWNLACFIEQRGKITIYEMSYVWRALDELHKEGKCTLAESYE